MKSASIWRAGLRRAVRRAAQAASPPPELTVSQWADRNLRLSPEDSGEHGQYQSIRAPYQREIMDACSDPAIESVILMSSSQIGKTTILKSVIGYYIDQDPSLILVIYPTLELAEAFSKDRLAPMIRDTPCLRGKIADPKARDSGNTLLSKRFPAGRITIVGANSPAGLAARPIRVVLVDEASRCARSAGTEGDPIALGFKRTRTFWNRKKVMCSTPTLRLGHSPHLPTSCLPGAAVAPCLMTRVRSRGSMWPGRLGGGEGGRHRNLVRIPMTAAVNVAVMAATAM